MGRHMKKPTWVRDGSSETWDLRLPSLTITVTRHVDLPENVWGLTCHQLGFEHAPLGNSDRLSAQVEAMQRVRKRLGEMMEEVETVYDPSYGRQGRQ